MAITPISSFPVHEYQTMIRERHLDTFGHVNNAQYMILFEEARWEMISSRGYTLEAVKASAIGTVVLECSVRFRRELKVREKITIRTFVKPSVKSASDRFLTLLHEIVKEDGKMAAEATFLVGCFDLKNRKLISPPPAKWRSVMTGVIE